MRKNNTDLHIRVQRERSVFDKGLNRTRYNQFFGHVNNCPARKRRLQLLKSRMTHARGKIVMEIGGRSWRDWIDFDTHAPRRLVCVNLSESELKRGIEKSEQLGTRDRIDFLLMDAHKLGLPDSSVDVIFGASILHHLEFEMAIAEVFRVLKLGGFALFFEPLGLNPIATMIRFLTPYARTPDERPLGLSQLRLLEDYFHTENTYYELLSVPAGLLSQLLLQAPINALTEMADKIDSLIERNLRFARPCFRAVVIYCRKKG